MILTIEGASGSGKSTLKKRLAEQYGLAFYGGYGFDPKSDRIYNPQGAPFVFSTIFNIDHISKQIERLLVMRTAMQLWKDDIIVDLFWQRIHFANTAEAELFVAYLTYEAPYLPSLSLVLDVSYETQIDRVLKREAQFIRENPKAYLQSTPIVRDETAKDKQTFAYLKEVSPYPIVSIDADVSADEVFQTAVGVIEKLGLQRA